MPLRRHTLRASTPGFVRSGASALPLSPFGLGCHRQARSVLVVPPDFDGFLRSSAAGLLHPAANHGVHCVSTRALPPAPGGVSDCSVVLQAPSPAPLLSRSVRSEIPISDHPPKVFPPPKPFLALFVRARSVASNPPSSSSQLAHLRLRSDVWLVPHSLFSKHEPRALSTEVVRSWVVPSRRCRSAPSSLLVASLPAFSRWLYCSRRKRLASPLDLRVFFRDGVRCDHSRCQF